MELPGVKQVSEMTGVPIGTLRYWRHSDIGPASFTLGAASCTAVMRCCAGSHSASVQPDVEAATPREVRTRERPRRLAAALRSNRPITQHGSSP